MYSPDEIPDRKRAFAAALLMYPEFQDAGKAAATVESRPAYATWMALQWRDDAEVLAMVAELREAGGLGSTLPTKEAFSLAVWQAANNVSAPDIKLKYLELFAKTMNFIEKPAAPSTVVNNVIDARRVMVVPEKLPHDKWKQKAIEQQARLVNAANG